ncbi:hypothetical protein BO94DRAFT_101067 [Aspergillus sclerotioniger CBS 115572]|uniref:Uncharacterized protein n=1 Tax=Aspergillus sclerotioniger CBS 115572 TaxID=1450535 RepID=A0A317WDP7_9EURO|nr:hypothetical protein BO94DRAFT_101067 [Aspergillus sclerotioniger CBS 115572]PWY84503.1 hypothetical protein BO94DRAFT_101067 [Aspergillus sclerotioniger CBS 115572]
MRATSAIKFPWSKLHLPLPRTPRQSKQLLNAITSSFRRQLDREYPTNNPSSSNRSDAPEEHSPATSNSSAHSTDILMHNILNNPLFRVNPSESAIASNAAGMRDIKQQRMMKEPMIIFEELVAAGHVETKDVFQCLQYQLMLAFASDDVGKAMKDSRAGTKVVNWLRASNWEDRLSIFCPTTHAVPRPSTNLLKFMVVEGMQNTVLLWLKMLIDFDIRDSSGRISRGLADMCAKFLLYDFIYAEIQYGGGLASAMRYYVQAKDLCSSVYSRERSSIKTIFRRSGRGLLWQAQRGVPDDGNKIPASIYSEYASVYTTIEPFSLFKATLALYHPTEPDPRPFLRFNRQFDLAQMKTLTPRQRDVFVHSCSDAIRILTDQGKRREATWLAGVLQHVSDQTNVGHEAPASMEEKESLSGLLQVELALT